MVFKNYQKLLVQAVIDKLAFHEEWKLNRDVFHWTLTHRSGLELIKKSTYWSISEIETGFFREWRITHAVNQCLAKQQLVILQKKL